MEGGIATIDYAMEGSYEVDDLVAMVEAADQPDASAPEGATGTLRGEVLLKGVGRFDLTAGQIEVSLEGEATASMSVGAEVMVELSAALGGDPLGPVRSPGPAPARPSKPGAGRGSSHGTDQLARSRGRAGRACRPEQGSGTSTQAFGAGRNRAGRSLQALLQLLELGGIGVCSTMRRSPLVSCSTAVTASSARPVLLGLLGARPEELEHQVADHLSTRPWGTISPPILLKRESRSVMNRKPSRSMWPMSPVVYHPSLSTSAVFSGMPM